MWQDVIYLVLGYVAGGNVYQQLKSKEGRRFEEGLAAR